MWYNLQGATAHIPTVAGTFSGIHGVLYDLRPKTWMAADDLLEQMLVNIPASLLTDVMLALLRQQAEQSCAQAEPMCIEENTPFNAFAQYGFTDRSILVEWRPYKEGATYTISRVKQYPPADTAASRTTLTTSALGTSFKDSTAQPGVLNRYTVTRNDDGKELGTKADSVIHVLPPTGFSATATTNGVSLAWNAADGASYYYIYRSGPYGTLEEAMAAADNWAAPLPEKNYFWTDGPITGTIDRDIKDAVSNLYVYGIRSYSPFTGLSDKAPENCIVVGTKPSSTAVESISIAGPTSVASGTSGAYTCTATYSDGHTETVSPAWSLSSGSAYGSISSAGVFTANTTTIRRSVTIQASYRGKSTTKDVTIEPETKKCIVTFDDNGGEGGWSRTMECGASLVAPVVTRAGFTFPGWVPSVHATVSESDATYVARWTDIGALPTDGDLYVDAATGDDSNDGKSWATAKASIQAAIDIAIPSDLILVNDGRYEPINVATSKKKNLTIASVHGAEKTIIDGSLQWTRGVTNRCATLRYSVSSKVYESKLEGFMLVNSWSTYGGGAYYGTLNNCVLIGNRATDYGGGVYGGTLNNCVLMGNRANYGGGSDSSTLCNCIIVGNIANSNGGGAQYAALTNCIVWNNMAPSNNACYDSTCRYTCSDTMLSGTGNIQADPLFIDAPNGDYRLRPGSPCIDAGTDSYDQGGADIGGRPRIVGERVDMGAWEYNLDAALAALKEALDGKLAWTTGGDSEWFDVIDDGAEGGTCAKSGVIGDSQTTWLETQIKGAGTVSFRWKVSSQIRLDLLSFSADGVRLAFIGGTSTVATNWAECSFEITGDGAHTLRWAYGKSASGTAGEDRAWLDNVRWKPVSIGAKIGVALEAPELVWSSGDYDADSWKTVGEDLAWDGEDACAAYAGNGSGVARLETSVNGPGTVSFHWRIDGGKAQAGIAFMVDGDDVDMCDSGAWTPCTASVTGFGSHTLVWEYFWDGETDGEAGFLDHVTWTPDATEPIPPLPGDATAETVAAAIESVGFADGEAVKTAIGGNAAKYNAFKEWAQTVKNAAGELAGEEAVVASEHAAVSWLLGAERLFKNEPAIMLTKVNSANGGENTGATLQITVEVKDGEVVVPVTADKVAEMVEATSNLSDWTGAPTLALAVSDAILHGDGTLTFTVVSGAPEGGGGTFLRIRVE